VARVMVEGEERTQVDDHAQRIADAIQTHLG
jgi:hypothetical protein